MAVVKNRDVSGGKEFWEHIEKIAAEVDKWPKWMRSRDPVGEAGALNTAWPQLLKRRRNPCHPNQRTPTMIG